MVSDPISSQAVVFVGLNNPHVLRAPRKICPSLCSKLPWVDWDITDKSAGFMYCCELESAREALLGIPKVKGEGKGGLLGVGINL